MGRLNIASREAGGSRTADVGEIESPLITERQRAICANGEGDIAALGDSLIDGLVGNYWGVPVTSGEP